jgi:hypothetical protein
MVKLEGQWRRNTKAEFVEPGYDHPYSQECFAELNGLLAAGLNGNPLVEFADTFLYGVLGPGAHLAVPEQPLPGLADGGADLGQDVRRATGELGQPPQPAV